MADDEKSKKTLPLVEGVKQSLVEELLAASGKNDNGSVDSEKLREEQVAILKKYDEQAGAAAEIFRQLGTDLSAAQKFTDGSARTLDELLVSKEPWPFDDISELSDRFGPLPKGYRYRYLVPETRFVPREVADTANNIIRLPSAMNLAIKAHLERPGDEIPDRSLGEWLDKQPAELVRTWALRVLSLFGVLKASDVPGGKHVAGSMPTAGTQTRPSSGLESVSTRPEVAELIRGFRDQAVLQYDGEERESDVSSLGGVRDKQGTFEELKALGPGAVLELRSLLDDRDIGVRVSAATYLLPSAPDLALPVLFDAVAHWTKEENEDRAYIAVIHAKQTLWMYEDGNLALGAVSPPQEAAKTAVTLLDDDEQILIEKFADFAIKSADAEREEDRHRAGSYSNRRIAIVATLDARSPEGRLALMPLLDHPDPAVRASAGAQLLKRVPERALPVLNKIRDSRDPVDTKHPRWRQARDSAWMTLEFYKDGHRDV